MASSGMTNDSVTPLAPIGIPQKVSSGNLHTVKTSLKVILLISAAVL
jgi:hypothetical protein